MPRIHQILTVKVECTEKRIISWRTECRNKQRGVSKSFLNFNPQEINTQIERFGGGGDWKYTELIPQIVHIQ
jgi:hypothetical protein